MRKIAVLCLLLSGCALDEDLSQPLSPVAIRTRLAGRTAVTSDNGRDVFIHFAGNGVATRNAETAEFGRWRTDPQGLCLQWFDTPETCAPVYQLNVSHYRVGDRTLSILGTP